jgi:hypothetical protein
VAQGNFDRIAGHSHVHSMRKAYEMAGSRPDWRINHCGGISGRNPIPRPYPYPYPTRPMLFLVSSEIRPASHIFSVRLFAPTERAGNATFLLQHDQPSMGRCDVLGLVAADRPSEPLALPPCLELSACPRSELPTNKTQIPISPRPIQVEEGQ